MSIAPHNLTFEVLKAKQRELRSGFSEALTLRVHRSLSWLGRGEEETDDIDVKFVLLWVGFNAAYADEIQAETTGERGLFKAYFDTLVSLDKSQRIYHAVWARFTREIKLLMANRYVFAAFWRHHNGIAGFDDWQRRLASSQKAVEGAMKYKDTARILSIVFDRLYMLRNQILHGGATWNSATNRNQVRDGAAVLGWLLPIFIDVMMDNPDHDWGKAFYPVVKEATGTQRSS
jgi:hypothetical protein